MNLCAFYYPGLSKPTALPLPAGGQGLSKGEGGRNLAFDNLKYPLLHHSITPEALKHKIQKYVIKSIRHPRQMVILILGYSWPARPMQWQ